MALLTLAETTYASRRALLDLAAAREMDLTVQFGDPELEAVTRLDLKAETERARIARDAVHALLSEESDVTSEAPR
ncbi:hypothetical protein ACIRJS_45875 [Streptomyces sp. NPDC102340]|uniref:hypothetical protein n=1 Tax=unclassified Streptomyces TaxID=2593676 RepID=UPI0038251D32